jgi:hypothetical protein
MNLTDSNPRYYDRSSRGKDLIHERTRTGVFSRGKDWPYQYDVGGGRYTPILKWYGAEHVTDMSALRGGRIGMREREGLVQVFIHQALRQAAPEQV